MYYDGNTRDLLRKFANKKVTFVDDTTGLIFEAYPFDVVDAQSELNKQFAIVGQASLQDFFDLLQVDYKNLPMKEGKLGYGWNYECFEGWDAPWIEFTVSTRHLYGRLMFNLVAGVNPCAVYEECMGCYSNDGYYTCDACLGL